MTEPIFKEEEKVILSAVDKAIASSKNSQTIGRNGEIPLITFLNNYLPPTLKAVSGHFLTPDKLRSPQIDILILDSRYPLLGYNADGTVLAMGHAVLKIIEIKTNLTKKDLIKTESNFSKIRDLISKIWPDESDIWSRPEFILVAYRISTKLTTIEDAYFSTCLPLTNHFDISIIRNDSKSDSGSLVHFEPLEENSSSKLYKEYESIIKDNHILTCIQERTPLADFYYNLIQNSYYRLDERCYSFGDIGAHFMDYLEWTTVKNKNSSTESPDFAQKK